MGSLAKWRTEWLMNEIGLCPHRIEYARTRMGHVRLSPSGGLMEEWMAMICTNIVPLTMGYPTMVQPSMLCLTMVWPLIECLAITWRLVECRAIMCLTMVWPFMMCSAMVWPLMECLTTHEVFGHGVDSSDACVSGWMHFDLVMVPYNSYDVVLSIKIIMKSLQILSITWQLFFGRCVSVEFW